MTRPRIAALVALSAAACGACNQVYCAPPGPDPYLTAIAARPRLPFRVLARREVANRDDRVAVFTHREQYDRAELAPVDFDTEEVLRVTVRAGAAAQIAWVAEASSALVVAVDARAFRCGGSAPAQEFDVAVARSVRPPHLAVERAQGSGCGDSRDR